MKTLSINCGSSSLKFKGFEMPEEKVLISGVFERIGMDGSFYTIKVNGEKIKEEVELNDHEAAFNILVKALMDHEIINDVNEIKGIGHRIVQGGSFFDKSAIASKENVEKVEMLGTLAPLHNPAAVVGLRAAQKVFEDSVQTLVFDTSFHQTMPEENYLYALPYEWKKEYLIRRYGAHGTSHKYVANRMNEILGKEDTKLITCHIGNGASISAVLNGKCINTSMGLTPNAGLIMGSRCGDIDATIVPYIMDQANLTTKEVDTILNKKSGLLGISGVSSDSRDIEDGIKNGNERCVLAQKMYVRRIVDYIAKYYVELEGTDAIIFTAGVGENSINTRKEILEGLKILGVTIDEEANKERGEEIKISGDDSSILCYVIPTDEEVMIARDTYSLIN